MFSSFGHLFRITTFGESHGGGVGVVIDGCPAGLELDLVEIQRELTRRKPGQSILTTPRQEADEVQILSGVFEGKTLGTPIALLVGNKDARPSSYVDFKDVYRPSHADYTYQAKYGIRNWMGGGRASARETIGRVAGGSIAEQMLRLHCPLRVVAWVESVHHVRAKELDPLVLTREIVDRNEVRCPDEEAASKMYTAIDDARRAQDSVGGVIACVAHGLPAGLGEPVFSKLEAELAKAMLSLPAVKGFEIGSGFAGTMLRGSEHNDPFEMKADGVVGTSSNFSGGIQGGISNGEPILMRIAFKPTATIGRVQQTVDEKGQARELQARGRHDPCVLPRAVPIVEAMTSLVLADAFLLQRARAGAGFSPEKGDQTL